ncbi:trehalose-6-phosphate hydrolase [Yersinia enterocolitica]|nr:trehalose-6-phosphate hydrolase [Yersinia enterocolitica]
MNNPVPWWQNGVIYQIYPKSFQDSTGNGYGDLAGVTQRLDYLQKLGVDAIWLTPVYVSPQVDNGYDVADYCAIDPAYGTLDDFKHLVEQAHQRGIRIVMDMVFNHTSTEHAWFKASTDRNSPYRQFYIWRDGKGDNLPNNWRSKFGGNAWQWHAASGQYYLHLFAIEQADLNWEHQPVRDELKKVCEFWADIGVDGLRLDVINLVSKQQDFPMILTVMAAVSILMAHVSTNFCKK